MKRILTYEKWSRGGRAALAAKLCSLLSLLSLMPSASAQLNPCGITWRQVNIPNAPAPLIWRASAYDTRRQVAVLFGGSNPLTGVHHTDETLELAPEGWSSRTPSVRPHSRHAAAMAYDSDRGVSVLFGGGTNIFPHEIPFNDTWEWDGTVWQQRQTNDSSAADRPPPMDFPVMVFDSFRKRSVLIASSERVGGEVQPANRTWEWDGNVWTAHAAQTPPLPRFGAAMAYDSAKRVTVLFGGTGEGADTWTWDGKIWQHIATGGTFRRTQHAMAFDDRRDVVVLFSGLNDGLAIGDTSEWDGVSWRSLGITPQFNLDLRLRRLHSMWYDTREQKVIIFGGTYSNRNPDGSFTHRILNDLWEAPPPGRWVDFKYGGAPALPETGEFHEPFSTLTEAVNAAPPGCTVILKAGSRAEQLTISKPLRLEAYNGVVTIGRGSP